VESSLTFSYIFHNHFRVFNENYSRTTGKRLFMTWIYNSFFITIVKVITTLIFASMAGYALARLKFYGRNYLFILILFSMMIPGHLYFKLSGIAGWHFWVNQIVWWRKPSEYFYRFNYFRLGWCECSFYNETIF